MKMKTRSRSPIRAEIVGYEAVHYTEDYHSLFLLGNILYQEEE